ncbi:MAG: bactofilin family protein [Bacillota bacterium]
MFGKNQSEKEQGKVETIIGSGTKVDGNLNTKGSLRIEGKIDGFVESEGEVFVGEGGNITADITARNVIIAGSVQGNINAKNKLKILASGKLNGDLKAKTLIIKEGAVFTGTSSLHTKNNKKLDENKNKSKKGEKDNKKKS